MDRINTVLYLIANLFNIYVYYYLYGIFFNKSNTKKAIEITCYLGFFVINSTAFLVIKNPLLNLASTIASLIGITFLYQSLIRTKLLVSLLVYTASMLLDSITHNILKHMDAWLDNRVLGLFLASMLLYLFALTLRRVRPDKTQPPLGFLYWFALFAIPVGSMVIVILAFLDGYSSWNTIIVVSVLLLTNVLIFQLYDVLGKYYQAEYEQRLLRQENNAFLHQIDMMQESNETIRMVRHDLTNQFIILKQLAKSGNYDQLDNVLDRVLKDFDLRTEYVCSGNPALDSLLNYKLFIAEKLGAAITLSVVIPVALPIDSMDMSVILGNLLDNSIEALEKSEEKKLDVALRFDRGILYIGIKNSYCGKLKKGVDNGKITYHSQKADLSVHGIGLSSVEKRVEKYNGLLEFKGHSGLFEADVMLYVP